MRSSERLSKCRVSGQSIGRGHSYALRANGGFFFSPIARAFMLIASLFRSPLVSAGDQRKNVYEFLTKCNILGKNDVKVHGF